MTKQTTIQQTPKPQPKGQHIANTISILGSGWLGYPLALSLLSEGYLIKTSTTRQERAEELKEKSLNPFLVNIDQESIELGSFLEADILIVNITSKSIKGFRALIHSIEQSSVQHVLFVSSTSVYPFNNSICHEKDADPSHPLAQIENLFQKSQHFKTTILRLAGTFGYSRHPGRFFKSGKVVRNPDSPVNLIHRDDCLHIIHGIIEQHAWGEIFNGVTDEHPTKRYFYSLAAKYADRSPLNFEKPEQDQVYKIISNDFLKTRLSYSFIHPKLSSFSFEDLDCA